MTVLQLHFAGGLKPELIRTVFEHALTGTKIITVRGKSGGAYSRQGTFQWTPAVRALSVLTVRTKSSALAQKPPVVLQSTARGAISALDYALGRKASWILDMFGIDREGHAIAHRVLNRSNPERKRPGPVAIALNQRFLSSDQIQIFLDGQELVEVHKFEALISSIIEQGDWQISLASYSSNDCFQEQSTNISTLQQLKPAFFNEARLMLRATDIFSRRALRNALTDLQTVPALQEVQTDFVSALQQIDLQLAGSDRLGLTLSGADFSLLFPGSARLRFGITPSQIGTILLLRFLRDVSKLPIEIDYSYAHTSDLAKKIASGGSKNFPECCVITTASSLLLSRKMRREYTPLMVMPAATHSIMGQAGSSFQNDKSSSTDYLLLSDFPTTPRFWFDTLQKTGAINVSKSNCIHADPDEALIALRTNTNNLRAILWFPYNIIAEQISHMVPLLQSPAPGVGLGFIQNVLFMHASIAKDERRARLLNILLRDAWLTLLADTQLCSALIQSQLEEKEYQRSLWRYSGLYRLEEQVAA